MRKSSRADDGNLTRVCLCGTELKISSYTLGSDEHVLVQVIEPPGLVRGSWLEIPKSGSGNLGRVGNKSSVSAHGSKPCTSIPSVRPKCWSRVRTPALCSSVGRWGSCIVRRLRSAWGHGRGLSFPFERMKIRLQAQDPCLLLSPTTFAENDPPSPRRTRRSRKTRVYCRYSGSD